MNTETEVALEEIELPTDFAEHMAAVSGLDAPPVTLEEWWTELLDLFSELDRGVTRADLYSEAPTRHEVHVDDRVRYTYCAMAALAAAVLEAQSTVTVRSVDPVSGTPVTFTVSDDAVEVSRDGALICYGSTVDADAVEAAGSLAAWAVQTTKTRFKRRSASIRMRSRARPPTSSGQRRPRARPHRSLQQTLHRCCRSCYRSPASWSVN